jgi:beta-lactamase class A
MRRREFLASTALLAGSVAVCAPAWAADDSTGAAADAHGAVPHLLKEFLALPGTKSAQIDVDSAVNAWRATHEPDAPLFCGSCFKTFVLAAYLQEVEGGRLDESEQLAVDDGVRSVSSSVFEHLTGTTMARNALEAMIAHSDNTATDVAMKRVGADRVRQFISDAGLKNARIPDSTRSFFSYVAGAPKGEDMGWKALSAIASAPDPNPAAAKFRPALNDVETMAVPASEFVSYYKRALTGGFFQKPETLV